MRKCSSSYLQDRRNNGSHVCKVFMERIVSDIGCWTEHASLARQSYFVVGFEVLTAVIMKTTIFCDRTPCSPLKVNQRFGGTCRLHLQGRRRTVLAICFHTGFLLGLLFCSEDGGNMLLRNFVGVSMEYMALYLSK
jgi:hypothetical protein